MERAGTDDSGERRRPWWRRWYAIAGAVVVGLVVLALALPDPDEDETVAASGASTTTVTTTAPATTATTAGTTTVVTTTAPPTTVSPTTNPTLTTAAPVALTTAAPTTVAPTTAPPTTVPPPTVTHVIDGDTVELSTGEHVRLVGIDAPEVGACGHDEAAGRLAALVEGRAVTLTPGTADDTDRYGRLLRYVDVEDGSGTVDAARVLLDEALAVPRYDSTDGYGHHAREDDYRATTASALGPCAAPPTTVPAAVESCDPNYDPCVPPYPPDLDCADIGRQVRVVGSDPHGLDGNDDDGLGCESY